MSLYAAMSLGGLTVLEEVFGFYFAFESMLARGHGGGFNKLSVSRLQFLFDQCGR